VGGLSPHNPPPPHPPPPIHSYFENCYILELLNNSFLIDFFQAGFHKYQKPIETNAAGDEQQHYGPDGRDAGEVQRESRGPRHREDEAIVRGEGKDRGPSS